MLARLFKTTAANALKSFRAKTGDTAFLNAAVAIAANVTAADGSIEQSEIDKSKKVILAHPAIEPAFNAKEIETALNTALDRAETRNGRATNAEAIEKMASRDEADRKALFLIGADVADVGEIGDKEHAALQRIADALGVNKAALLEG
ncbi:TerB family tellurite resistance protein [uncultured Methylobacterium sp.]|jgi:tellurite resistance protein|uniref:TerB family tellurite resistance protein n=1 Tax=uncultured Methylobacterium sp. TaxID=157278 RepID=UPI002607A27C|nr:TerB family tellurite resistance protein [uncultured Methylobacterium sp.]